MKERLRVLGQSGLKSSGSLFNLEGTTFFLSRKKEGKESFNSGKSREKCKLCPFYERNMYLQNGEKRLGRLHPSPVIKRGCSSAGRAPALQAGGQEFDPPHLHHLLSFSKESKQRKLQNCWKARRKFGAEVILPKTNA